MSSFKISSCKFNRQLMSLGIIFAFLVNILCPSIAFSQVVSDLPPVGTMVSPSADHIPLLLKGITVHPDNPLMFDFVFDTGNDQLNQDQVKVQSNKLIKYFLASLTVPEKDLWVNLSPYEENRIIPKEFGLTEMGTDLLAQDYVLKQLASSLMHPEDETVGKKFWADIHEEVYQRYGVTNIPVNSLNKVWIVPKKAKVFQHDNTAFLMESEMDVMLEGDYLALSHHMNDGATVKNNLSEAKIDEINEVSSEILREVILPAIRKEVNKGKHFALLRQIYGSMVLATWFKKTLNESFLAEVYVDKNKVDGVDSADKNINNKIYDQYVEAFKAGVYNFIKEEYDPVSERIIPKKYFSGGFDGALLGDVFSKEMNASDVDSAQLGSDGMFFSERVAIDPTTKDGAILSEVQDFIDESVSIIEQMEEVSASGNEGDIMAAYELARVELEGSSDTSPALLAIGSEVSAEKVDVDHMLEEDIKALLEKDPDIDYVTDEDVRRIKNREPIVFKSSDEFRKVKAKRAGMFADKNIDELNRRGIITPDRFKEFKKIAVLGENASAPEQSFLTGVMKHAEEYYIEKLRKREHMAPENFEEIKRLIAKKAGRTQQEQDFLDAYIDEREQEFLDNHKGYVKAEEDHFRFLYASAVKHGLMGTQYLVTNIKKFSDNSHVAYINFIKKFVKQFNGHVVVFLSIEEHPKVLNHDAPGMTTAMQALRVKFRDKFGEAEVFKKLSLDGQIKIITDGGLKERGGNWTGKYGYNGVMPTPDGESYYMRSFKTLGVTSMQHQKFGGDRVFWTASDGDYVISELTYGKNRIADLSDDDDWKMIIHGEENAVFDEKLKKDIFRLMFRINNAYKFYEGLTEFSDAVSRFLKEKDKGLQELLDSHHNKEYDEDERDLKAILETYGVNNDAYAYLKKEKRRLNDMNHALERLDTLKPLFDDLTSLNEEITSLEEKRSASSVDNGDKARLAEMFVRLGTLTSNIEKELVDINMSNDLLAIMLQSILEEDIKLKEVFKKIRDNKLEDLGENFSDPLTGVIRDFKEKPLPIKILLMLRKFDTNKIIPNAFLVVLKLDEMNQILDVYKKKIRRSGRRLSEYKAGFFRSIIQSQFDDTVLESEEYPSETRSGFQELHGILPANKILAASLGIHGSFIDRGNHARLAGAFFEELEDARRRGVFENEERVHTLGNVTIRIPPNAVVDYTEGVEITADKPVTLTLSDNVILRNTTLHLTRDVTIPPKTLFLDCNIQKAFAFPKGGDVVAVGITFIEGENLYNLMPDGNWIPVDVLNFSPRETAVGIINTNGQRYVNRTFTYQDYKGTTLGEILAKGGGFPGAQPNHPLLVGINSVSDSHQTGKQLIDVTNWMGPSHRNLAIAAAKNEMDYWKMYQEVDLADGITTEGKGEDEAQLSYGGIDFNPEKLDLVTDGEGNVSYEVDPAMLNSLRIQGVDGFAPVIINIVPLPSVLPLLGFKEEDQGSHPAISLN